MSDMKVYTGPMRFAHRGVVQAAPENTLGAFEAAVNAGLEGIEIDIRMSRDGEIVVVHDETLTRMTQGHPAIYAHARVADLTWEELSVIELPYAGHLLQEQPPAGATGEFPAQRPLTQLTQGEGGGCTRNIHERRTAKLMRLADLLRWLADKPANSMLEIEYKAPGMMPRLMELLSASPVRERCIVFSGEPALIAEIQSFCGREGKPEGLKLGANIRRLTEEAKTNITRMDLYEIGLNDGCVTKADMDWLGDRGIKAFSNLGDYPAWWETVCALGMHGLKTNYAAAYTQWWTRYSEQLIMNNE